MQIEKNKSLKLYNSFNVECTAGSFVEVTTINELREILRTYGNQHLFILGGGSNMLLTQNISALVTYINLKGITIEHEDEDSVIVNAQAGENWHDLVLFCLEHNYGGIENLSLIPGNVGTAPIQNIGAYGVELKDVFVSCQVIDIVSLEEKVISKEDCQFDYRNSIFKNKAKGKYIITSVSIQLTKHSHKLTTSYGAIQNVLSEHSVSNPTIKAISDAVIEIRRSKLPDPKTLGNSGSFFKNPIIDLDAFTMLSKTAPEVPFYKLSDQEFKIPAAWLIEQIGIKGQRFGDTGVHENHALVLVNYGNASGKDIWNFAVKIRSEVKNLFGIELEPEVNIF